MTGMLFSVIVNILIAAAVFVCVVKDIMRKKPVTKQNFKLFRYFTVLSNVFMGVISAIFAVYAVGMLAGIREAIPLWLNVLKLSATGCVVLTMLTTALFLGPTAKDGFFSMFKGSSLYLHLLVPVASAAVFLICERTGDLTAAHALLAALPVLAYGIGYLINAVVHAESGKVAREHDWYGFVSGGLKYAWISMPAMLAAGVAIMLALRALNRV